MEYYFNLDVSIDFNNNDILFQAPNAPRKKQNPKPHNPRVLPGTQLKIRAPPSRKSLFKPCEMMTPPRAPKRQRTRKAPVEDAKRSAACRSLFSENLTEQTQSVRPVPSVHIKLQLLCQDMDNINPNKDLNIRLAPHDNSHKFVGVADFLSHDLQILDNAEQQKTPEAGSLNNGSDDKEKHAMVSVHCNSIDEEKLEPSDESCDVLME